ncbi:tumor necrosis factor receptor superfamily member 10B [Onychomys torridus]|uniref:tumor necrosis factor receptor superfamily member 10B n=1 Tax=Onychomys torridus TaxID=38674 RepID=UPI00167F293E|nr:tumor necrosis factor receptor superfamily member 10B [Onychomys torridus]
MAPTSSYQYSEPYKRNTIYDLMHQIVNTCFNYAVDEQSIPFLQMLQGLHESRLLGELVKSSPSVQGLQALVSGDRDIGQSGWLPFHHIWPAAFSRNLIICSLCVPRCTNGEVEETSCTPKTNRKCISLLGLIIVLVVPLLVVGALAIICKTRLWKRVLPYMKRAYPGREQDPESVNAVNESLMGVQTSSMGNDSRCDTELEEAVSSLTGRDFLVPANGIDPVDGLKQIFSFCPSAVPYNSWNSLMRQMGLTDNEIQVVRAETQGLQEVLYQMLLKWLNQTGRSASINHLLDALEAVGERCARHKIEDHAVDSGKFVYQKATAEPGMVTHASTEETELEESL